MHSLIEAREWMPHMKSSATVCYMRTITHREMRNNSAEILRAVAAGETVQVTNNGQVAAILSPPHVSALDALRADGSVRPARVSADAFRRIVRTRSKLSSREILADSRGPW